MSYTQTYDFMLKYPDGWEEHWAPLQGATKVSLVACALQMLDAAGVEWGIAIEHLSEDMVRAMQEISRQRQGQQLPATSSNGPSPEVENQEEPPPEYTPNMALHDGDPGLPSPSTGEGQGEGEDQGQARPGRRRKKDDTPSEPS